MSKAFLSSVVHNIVILFVVHNSIHNVVPYTEF